MDVNCGEIMSECASRKLYFKVGFGTNRAIDGIVAAKECNLNCGTERAIYSASDMCSSMYTLRQTRRTGRLEWREPADPSKVANVSLADLIMFFRACEMSVRFGTSLFAAVRRKNYG